MRDIAKPDVDAGRATLTKNTVRPPERDLPESDVDAGVAALDKTITTAADPASTAKTAAGPKSADDDD